jgi:hypothetical protein
MSISCRNESVNMGHKHHVRTEQPESEIRET